MKILVYGAVFFLVRSRPNLVAGRSRSRLRDFGLPELELPKKWRLRNTVINILKCTVCTLKAAKMRNTMSRSRLNREALQQSVNEYFTS